MDPGSDDRTDIEGEEDRTRNSYPMLNVGGNDLPLPCNSPRQFRGPIAAAIGLVSRMATGLLGFRGGNREAGNNRNGQVCGPTKHGLEEILDDDEAGSSREPRHVVDRLRKLDSTPGRCFSCKLLKSAAMWNTIWSEESFTNLRLSMVIQVVLKKVMDSPVHVA